MYYLVQFIEDNILEVCHRRNIRRRKNFCTAKWQVDRKFYPAKILTLGDPLVLTDLCRNSNEGFPKILLSAVDKRMCEEWLRSPDRICKKHCQRNAENVPPNFIVGNLLEYDKPDDSIITDDNILGQYIACDKCPALIKEAEFSSHDFAHNQQDISSVMHEESLPLCFICGELVLNLSCHLSEAHELQDIQPETISQSNRRKYNTKRHFCCFCKTLQTKLARHLETKHLNVPEVSEAVRKPKGSKERKNIFLNIQKNGDYIFNVENQQSISLRRSHKENSQPCPYCKGFYSAANLRNHVRLFCPFGKKESNLQVMSRSMNMKIHESASDVLKTEILPRMTNDHILSAVAFDELVIKYGNFMAMKYSSSKHHHQMIRNKIRHISRVFLEMKKVNPTVINVTSIFDPSNFDTFIAAIHKMAGFTGGQYDIPSLGPSTVTLFTHLGNFLIAESIKKKDEDLEKNVERFLKLLTTTSNALINKTANDTRTQNQRTVLPKKEDVKKFNDLLDFKLKECLGELEQHFDKSLWADLSKIVVIKLMTFNRKRPGDVEKTRLIEYENLQTPDEEELSALGCEDKKLAQSYGRYITRGKLNSPAAVFVSSIEMKAIKILQKYRDRAGVDIANPYLFATPKGTAEPFLKAAKALSDFCNANNLQNKNITATKLRKHLASETSNLDRSKQGDISDFMGHAIDIHNKIYRQHPVLHDILQIGKVLRDVSGQRQDDVGELANCENIRISPSTYNEDLREVENNMFSENNNENVLLTSNNYDEDIEEYHKHPVLGLTTEARTCALQRNEECSELSDDSDYMPELSTIEEDEDHFATTSSFTRKRKLSTPVFSGRKRPRKTWTTPERHAIRETFKQYFDNEDLGIPSLSTCQEFVQGKTELENRSVHQIRSWIVYERKRRSERSKQNVSRSWTTPTRQLCRKLFRKFYESKIYPSSIELQEAIDNHQNLRHTTVGKLRSHLQYDFRYIQKNKYNTE